MNDAVLIRPAAATDAAAVARIYNHYVRETTITFEEVEVPAADVARRIADAQAADLPWLVAERAGAVVGYAYAGKFHSRSAYRFSVEVTVYVDVAHPRRGFGARLYAELFPMLEAKGIHVLIAAIALPNEPSIGLHERLGFVKVGELRDVGFKLERWVAVGYWQRTLSAG